MAPATQVLFTGALTFGVPLALALHELIALRRRPSGGPPDSPPPPPPTPLPPESFTRPLPACLIPQRRPERILELV